MKNKTLLLLGIIAFFSLVHLGLCFFYPQMYAYFSGQAQLTLFLSILRIFRWALYVAVALAGLFSLQKKETKFVPVYLLFFLFNILLPNIFASIY
ncbi:hypothetical protein BAU15_12890 [Enterococcus sp. JM4C]|uniref:hypothetical protein n=1 Tax=Candidatus Enterococcus huntleyi TaxID=1857217 RepID=UPI00137B8F5C|nr:hypothetical protein [Enterococcus sp. JM4C]KAF1296445.1 hypothetical protein BAU15_12890 [Enterococcus sp. JM4C]